MPPVCYQVINIDLVRMFVSLLMILVLVVFFRV
nr:MAG TPA: hypothetical protein [Caudoviricetes sp.]DAU06303.1 MAG TPA: hypothetical protein [Caudoviricetes sp.]DAX21716.1 MAG TPA: hypothetical protein [Caudoviricetes sp.]